MDIILRRVVDFGIRKEFDKLGGLADCLDFLIDQVRVVDIDVQHVAKHALCI